MQRQLQNEMKTNGLLNFLRWCFVGVVFSLAISVKADDILTSTYNAGTITPYFIQTQFSIDGVSGWSVHGTTFTEYPPTTSWLANHASGSPWGNIWWRAQWKNESSSLLETGPAVFRPAGEGWVNLEITPGGAAPVTRYCRVAVENKMSFSIGTFMEHWQGTAFFANDGGFNLSPGGVSEYRQLSDGANPANQWATLKNSEWSTRADGSQILFEEIFADVGSGSHWTTSPTDDANKLLFIFGSDELNINRTNIAELMPRTNSINWTNSMVRNTNGLTIGVFQGGVEVLNQTMVDNTRIINTASGNNTDRIIDALGDLAEGLEFSFESNTNVSDQGTHLRLDQVNSNLFSANEHLESISNSSSNLFENVNPTNGNWSALDVMSDNFRQNLLNPFGQALTNIDADAQSAVSTEQNSYEAVAGSASFEQEPFGSDILTITIGDVTFNANPFTGENAIFGAVATWIKTILIWLLTATYIGWAYDKMNECIANSRSNSSHPNGLFGSAWKIAGAIIMATFLSSLPTIFMAYISLKFGDSTSLSVNPVLSGNTVISQGVWLLYRVLPVNLILTSIVSGIAYRIFIMFYLRAGQLIMRFT